MQRVDKPHLEHVGNASSSCRPFDHEKIRLNLKTFFTFVHPKNIFNPKFHNKVSFISFVQFLSASYSVFLVSSRASSVVGVPETTSRNLNLKLANGISNVKTKTIASK